MNVNDSPNNIAQKGSRLLKTPIMNMDKNTTIKDHSKPNQNNNNKPIIMDGLRMKIFKSSFLFPSGSIQSEGKFFRENHIVPEIKRIQPIRIRITRLSNGLYLPRIKSRCIGFHIFSVFFDRFIALKSRFLSIWSFIPKK